MIYVVLSEYSKLSTIFFKTTCLYFCKVILQICRFRSFKFVTVGDTIPCTPLTKHVTVHVEYLSGNQEFQINRNG